jgi:hypothetical protein
MQSSVKDITGRRHQRWLVKSFVEMRGTRSFWLCVCDCGNEKIIVGSSLRPGGTGSCGCLRREVTRRRNIEENPAVIKHGMTGTAEWSAYKDARHRCTYRSNPRWKDYGGRGIKFLFTSFEQFFKEVGPRPEGLTLDRKDNNGNYELGNVRWATAHEQRINQRR